MGNYREYSEIKRLVEEYFELKEDKKYEEFIRKLVMILRI